MRTNNCSRWRASFRPARHGRGAAPSSLARRSGPQGGAGTIDGPCRPPQPTWTRRGRAHPQLLHHQPRRPRQVDPVGPHPRAHRRRRPPPHAGAVPRLHGHRAGAGDHHQGPERPGRARRPHPPPHRHPGPRRLRLRGLPLAGRLRGGGAAGGRAPRGSRPRRWPTATRPSSTTSRSCRSSTRSTCRPPTRCAARSRSSTCSGCPPRTSCTSRPRRGRGCASCSTPSSPASRRPAATPTAPLRALIFDSSYDQYRGVVSSIRIVDGTLHTGARLRFMQANAVHDIEEVGVRTPDALPVRRARPRRGRATSSPGSRTSARRARARPSPRRNTAPPRRWPATGTPSPWSSAACTRSTATSCPTCATRSRSSSSTTPASPSSPSPPARSASASAAASSACCTWRSCASAWSASSTCR